jgi:hypothetical protein
MYIEHNIVMLATNEKAHFGDIILTPTFPQKLVIFEHQNCTEVAQHLYITSNEEIKEGNWFISELGEIWQHNGNITPSKLSVKIIATTDDSLEIRYDNRFIDVIVSGESLNGKLPKIPQQFIERYISEYNKGNVITQVMVLYHWGDDDLNLFRDTPILKVNYDNTINIQLIKTSWTKEEREELIKTSWTKEEREELIIFFNKLKNDVINKHYGQITNLDLPKWIEENL